MKVLIIDNEPALRKALQGLIREYCPDIVETETAEGVSSGVRKIQSFRPDIVLLDVEMEDGTGFDLLRQVPQPAFALIFVTAHDKYAIDAFRFSAIDYLLKPVEPEALRNSVQKARQQVESRSMQQQIVLLLQQISGLQQSDRKIVLKDLENTYFIRVKDILYCEADGTYTHFFIQDNAPILVSRNLKEYASILEPLGFIRTHHSFLVNPEKIRLFDKRDGGQLVLEGGAAVPVSQRKKDQVLQMLEKK